MDRELAQTPFKTDPDVLGALNTAPLGDEPEAYERLAEGHESTAEASTEQVDADVAQPQLLAADSAFIPPEKPRLRDTLVEALAFPVVVAGGLALAFVRAANLMAKDGGKKGDGGSKDPVSGIVKGIVDRSTTKAAEKLREATQLHGANSLEAMDAAGELGEATQRGKDVLGEGEKNN